MLTFFTNTFVCLETLVFTSMNFNCTFKLCGIGDSPLRNSITDPYVQTELSMP